MNDVTVAGRLAREHSRRPLVTALDALVFSVCLAGGAASNVILDHPAPVDHRLLDVSLPHNMILPACCQVEIRVSAIDVLDRMSEMYQENSK